MKKRKGKKIFGAAVLALFLGGGAAAFYGQSKPAARWYAPAQAAAGGKIYAVHCVSCHGINGAGDANWRRRGADGKFPPPPLNGTAHTWHHPLAALRRTIVQGGAPFGGAMPAFGGKLDAAERDAVIAHFQSFWTDEIYRAWAEIDKKHSAKN